MNMLFFDKKGTIWAYTAQCRAEKKSIGLVPTMGALHEGHLSLVREARQTNEIVLATIFVNPTQFNNPEDLKKYPRTLEKDLQMLESAGCDAVFVPDDKEMYSGAPLLKFNFGALESVMEGKHRPGHFNGVALVVSKLFHLTQPHQAYFGQKDLQQFAIIRQLVDDLSFQIQLHCCSIVREADGLAMSSRNSRLSKEGRQVAPQIYAGLQNAEAALKSQGIEAARQSFLDHVLAFPTLQPEYIEVAHTDTLQPLNTYEKGMPVALCTAVFLEGVRLIDNLLIK